MGLWPSFIILAKSSFRPRLLEVSILLRPPIGDVLLERKEFMPLKLGFTNLLVLYFTSYFGCSLRGTMDVTKNLGVFLLLEAASSDECSVTKASVFSSDAILSALVSLMSGSGLVAWGCLMG